MRPDETMAPGLAEKDKGAGAESTVEGRPAPHPVSPLGPTHPPGATATDEAPSTGAGSSHLARPVGERFTLGEEIGRGGMGRVVAAYDRLLGRRVALKLLLSPESTSMQRFEREALLTARLQHPGIVAVYDAGRLSSGETFYAMRLVSGRTLQALIAERPTLAERLALLPNVLAAAEAVGYAHREKVVHRDLKPSNIIVGELGETQVIDWGVAKDLQAPAPEPDSPESRAGVETSWGTVIGTPAFMAPEQARGLPIDERADVWALGATLYALLAGEQPYTGTSAEIVEQLQQGEPPPPLREREPGTPAALVAIVAKAMQRDPARRYASAGELAEDLRRFQTGQLVSAHRYSRPERLRRWVARHRGALTASAVGAAALLVLGTTSIIGVVRARDLAERERAAAVNERRAAEELVRFLLGELQARLRPIGRLDVLEGVGERVERYYQDVSGPERPLDASARGRRAEALDGLSKVRLARAQNEAALRAADDAMALRGELARSAPGKPVVELDMASAHLQRANVLRNLGRLDDAAQECELAIDEIRRAQAAQPGPASLQRRLLAGSVLGSVRFRQGKYSDALAAYADARAAGTELLAAASHTSEDRQRLADVLSGIGRAHIELGHTVEARAALREGLRLQDELALAAPKDPTLLRELGTTLTRIGQVEVGQAHFAEARAALERSIDVLGRAVAIDGSDTRSQVNLSAAIDRLASLERAGGRYDEAARRYREALDATKRLLDRGPQLDVRHNLMVSLQHAGIGAFDVGAWSESAARLRESLQVGRELLAGDAGNKRVREAMAISQFNLGDALVRDGDRAAARTAYGECVTAAELLSASDPKMKPWIFEAALCRHRLGALDAQDGKTASAVELLRAAVRGMEAAGEPDEVENAAALPIARADLAAALGSGEEATALYAKARASWTELRARPNLPAPLERDLALLARKVATESR